MSEANNKAEEVGDFGFSFEDDMTNVINNALDTRDTTIMNLETEVQSLRENNRTMYKKILVLLNNLKKNPEQPIIKWPNRVEAIDKFIAELEELYAKAKKG